MNVSRSCYFMNYSARFEAAKLYVYFILEGEAKETQPCASKEGKVADRGAGDCGEY